MLSAKLLVLLTLQVISVLGLGNNPFLNLPELDQDQLNWPQKKIETIEYLLNTLTEVGNVTLVGWQQIWNSDGTLKGIRTIELTIFSQVSSEFVLSLEDVDVYGELPAALEMLDSLTDATGILATGSFVQKDRSGDTLNILTLDPDSIHINIEENGFMYWQQNITVSRTAPIKTLVETLQQQSPLPVSFLEWNSDGTLNIKSSVIVPEILATIKDAQNATLPILEASLTGTVKGMLLEPESPLQYVANYLKQSVPGFKWIVGEDWSSTSLDADVSVTVQYNLVDIGQDTVFVNIIGVNI